MDRRPSLILSDVGGARELIERDPTRSVLIPNASGAASDVTDARVERARWRAGRQRNSSELATAVRRVVNTVHRERGEPRAPRDASDGVSTMIAAHAHVIRKAAQTKPTDPSLQPVRVVGDQLGGAVTR